MRVLFNLTFLIDGCAGVRSTIKGKLAFKQGDKQRVEHRYHHQSLLYGSQIDELWNRG
jgi:hypothetical protein